MEVKFRVFLVFLIKIGFLINFTHSNEVVGCGGFVKSSRIDIDYSKVEVKLFTKQGSLKEKTECSPSNGYYFLPVYDKGEYILTVSPPPGWSFEPESVELNFDGKTDICSKGQDVNFVFKGFGITGRVTFAGGSGGAKNVRVVLQSEDDSDTRETLTDNYGIYSFSPVVPKKYTIKGSHNKWRVTNLNEPITVGIGNTELPDKFIVVSGFDVQGKITSNGPLISSIGLALFKSNNNQNLPSECQKGNVPQVLSNNPTYAPQSICYSQVDKNGDYTFQGVAPGIYLIKPIVSDKEANVHIKPDFIEFKAVKDTVVLKDNFVITGFSISGKLLSNENLKYGRGIANAKVYLDGKEEAVTTSDGSYILKNIKGGTYRMIFKHDDYYFEDKETKILATDRNVPDKFADGVKVCGEVISDGAHTLNIQLRGSSFKTSISTKVDSNKWCTKLPNGKLDIEVFYQSGDAIQLFPAKQTIEVKGEPVHGIVFSQLKATVTGVITCLPDSSSNCPNIEVTLHSLEMIGQSATKTKINAKEGKYTFSNVLPGNYKVTIPQSNLCWETTSHTLNVKSSSETIEPFIHKGYEISIISSHKNQLEYDSETDKTVKKIELMSGVNTFCVNQAGEYNIRIHGCHKYDSLPQKFSTHDSNPVIITAVAHKVGIRILSEEFITEPMSMLIESKNGKNVVVTTPESDKVDDYYSYRYNTYMEPDESITLTPQSTVMLFEPSTKFIIGGNDCIDVAFSFMAARGLIIEGKIVPRIQGAKITLTFPDKPDLTPLETISTESGEFKFTPVDGNLQVEIKAEKESYVFSNYNKNTKEFTAYKLGEVIATVKDNVAKSLSGVLLSLSGGQDYRKNLVTGEDGKIKFHSLSPGKYFLRPMMNEYKFNPSSIMIEVKDGETVEVELSGDRFAYSVFGTLRALDGTPYANVVIEAISGDECNNHQAEATTGPDGEYRIRALTPGCTYLLQGIQGDKSNVERTIPSQRIVTISNEDVRGTDFFAVSTNDNIFVKAKVTTTSPEFYKSLRIVLYRVGFADSPIYSQRLESPADPDRGVLVFFPAIPRDRRWYQIELQSTLSEDLYVYNYTPYKFEASGNSALYVDMAFRPVPKITDEYLDFPYSALFIGAFLALIFLRQDLAASFADFVWSRINSIIQENLSKRTKKKDNRYNETINYKEIEELAEGINSIKKKKSKKT